MGKLLHLAQTAQDVSFTGVGSLVATILKEPEALERSMHVAFALLHVMRRGVAFTELFPLHGVCHSLGLTPCCLSKLHG